MITEFEQRYAESYKGVVHVRVERFDELDVMKEALVNDLNATKEKTCGEYMGNRF